jgi:hypothetical protein
MALSVDWISKIITVPKADMTLVQGSPEIRALDINAFRLELKDLEDGEGMPFVDTHSHNPPVSVGGVSLGRVVEIINGYTVTFEDGQYAVNLTGANSNISDVANVNQVSIRAANSAGLVLVETGVSGLTAAESLQLGNILKVLINRTELTEGASGNFIVYDDDDTTPLYTHDVTDKDGDAIILDDGIPAERSRGS